jgi:putative photosynthetic complex assembly protein
MIVLALGAAVIGRFGDVGTSRVPDSALVAGVPLVFLNGADGSVVIRQPDGQAVRTVRPGEDGFIWGAINGLSRGRKLNGVGPGEPYTLGRRADGRLVLEDPSTGQAVLLDAFGHGNQESFARLLDLSLNPSRSAP